MCVNLIPTFRFPLEPAFCLSRYLPPGPFNVLISDKPHFSFQFHPAQSFSSSPRVRAEQAITQYPPALAMDSQY